MDSSISAQIATQMGLWSTATLAKFAIVIPIALGVVITVAVTYALIKHFRAMSHM